MAVRVSCTADQRESVGAMRVGCGSVGAVRVGCGSVGAVRVGCGSVPVTRYMFSRDGQPTLEKDIFLFAYD